MCRVLEVSVSSYYAWIQRPTSKRTQENLELMRQIREIYDDSHQTYGSPRIAAALWKRGLKCSRCRVARLMQFIGIKSKTARKFKVTTDSNHHEPVSPNLLAQDFSVEMPNTVWTSDITYLRTESGWQYLTVILELFNREIIGYSLSSRLTTETTVIPALDMAVLHCQPRTGVIFHSDRGSQYASRDFRKKLQSYQMVQSMSSTGNCYDNAVTETFFKTLKTECVYGVRYQSPKALRQSLFEYIEIFYNRKRLHSALGYLAPAEFLQQHQQSKVMAS